MLDYENFIPTNWILDFFLTTLVFEEYYNRDLSINLKRLASLFIVMAVHMEVYDTALSL